MKKEESIPLGTHDGRGKELSVSPSSPFSVIWLNEEL